jgi:gas vesicle protein
VAKQGKSRSGSGFFFGLLLGVAVGATLGILFAPQAGEETRAQLSDSTTDLRKFGKDGYQGFAAGMRERLDDALAQGRAASTRASDEVLSRYNKIKSGS